uniref:Uncharacterized protein n=1 Tax=Sphaerodactylus townsendi TaxID=933632 RepID=A0ACB8G9Z2_9SAUR
MCTLHFHRQPQHGSLFYLELAHVAFSLFHFKTLTWYKADTCIEPLTQSSQQFPIQTVCTGSDLLSFNNRSASCILKCLLSAPEVILELIIRFWLVQQLILFPLSVLHIRPLEIVIVSNPFKKMEKDTSAKR